MPDKEMSELAKKLVEACKEKGLQKWVTSFGEGMLTVYIPKEDEVVEV